MKLISPSLLSADFGNLQRDIEMLNESECDLITLLLKNIQILIKYKPFDRLRIIFFSQYNNVAKLVSAEFLLHSPRVHSRIQIFLESICFSDIAKKQYKAMRID